MFTCHLKDEKETASMAKKAAECVTTPMIIFFEGELGAGKSTFIRSMAKSLGINDKIKSPTYTLIEIYEYNQKKLLHADFYRLEQPLELEALGIEEYLTDNTLVCIEWANVFQQYFNIKPDWIISLRYIAEEEGRKIEIQALTELGNVCLNKLG